MRLCSALLFLVCATLSFVPAAQAQVAIEERVEIAPEAAARGQYDYQPRGKGEYVFYGQGASSTGEPLGGTFSVATSDGDVHSTSVTSGFSFSDEYLRGVCSEVEYYHRNYSASGDLLRVRVDADEVVDSLWFARGDEVDVNAGLSPTAKHTYDIGCGFRWTNRCWCLEGYTYPYTGLTARGRFEADPPDALQLTADRDTIAFQESGREAASFQTLAVYSSGEQAPLADSTEITYTVSSPYGQLHDIVAGHVGSPRVLEYGDRGGGRLYFDTKEAALASGPACDELVSVFASGGGVGGEAQVVVRGSGPPPASDTLIVTVSPWDIAAGDSARVFGRYQKTGCGPGTLPDTTQVLVAISSLDQGSLKYDGLRGAAFVVPYGELRDGQVQFMADSISCDSARVAASAFVNEGLWGEAEFEVQAAQGRPAHTAPGLGRVGCGGALAFEHDPATKAEVEQLIRDTCPGQLPSELGMYFQASVRASLNAATQGHPIGIEYSPGPGPTVRPVDGWLNGLRDVTKPGWPIIPGYVTSILEVKFNEMRRDVIKGSQYRSHMDDLARSYTAEGGVMPGAPLYIIATNSQNPRIEWLGSNYRSGNLPSEAARRGINVMHLRVTRDGSDFYLSGDLIGPKADVQSWIKDFVMDWEHPFVVSCTPDIDQ
ncbi:MAG: hypothetical protein AAGI91_10835 [Bacteroidota bacterium]